MRIGLSGQLWADAPVAHPTARTSANAIRVILDLFALFVVAASPSGDHGMPWGSPLSSGRGRFVTLRCAPPAT